MKLKQLIEMLQSHLQEHGNGDIIITNREEGEQSPTGVMTVEEDENEQSRHFIYTL